MKLTVKNIILPVIGAIIVVALFFLFKPEGAGALFYTNLVYTVLVVESFFFLYLYSVGKKENTSVAFTASLWVTLSYYLIAGIIWLLLYSLLLRNFVSYNIYLSVHIVLLFLWVVVAALVKDTDKSYQKEMNAQQQRLYSINDVVNRLNLSINRLSNALSTAPVDFTSVWKEFDLLIKKIKYLPPYSIESANGQSLLKNIINEMNDMEIGDNLGEEELAKLKKNLENQVKQYLNQLNYLSNHSKK